MPALAIGTSISLSTTTNTIVKTDIIQIEISITNEGDEVALIELLSTQWDGRQWMALQKPIHLPPATSVSKLLEIPRKIFPRGRSHLIFNLDYKDRAGRSFSALAYAEVQIGQTSTELLKVKTNDLALDDTAFVYTEIQNQSSNFISARLNLILPGELSIEGQQEEIDIDPRASQKFATGIKNVSALPGSQYTGLVTIIYDVEDIRHSIVSPFRLDVTMPVTKNAHYRNQILIILILWLSVIVVKELIGIWPFRR